MKDHLKKTWVNKRRLVELVVLGLVAVMLIITVNNSIGNQKVIAAVRKEPITKEKLSMSYDIDNLAASVVRLEIFNSDGDRIGTGSGFAAYAPGLLITARHVVVNMDYITATRDDGSTFRIDRIIAADEPSDIAICALPEEAGLEPLEFVGELPKRGSKAMVVSSQFGITNLVTTGDFCGIWKADDTDWILFTAPVSGGSSGGPVFDAKGRVIGVVRGTYEKGQNLNIAANSNMIESLCRSISE